MRVAGRRHDGAREPRSFASGSRVRRAASHRHCGAGLPARLWGAVTPRCHGGWVCRRRGRSAVWAGHERASSALGAPREAASAAWGLGRVVRDAAGRPEHGFRHTGEQEGLPPGHACEREADRTAVDPGAQATHLASPLTHLRPLRRIADRPPGLPAARRGPSPPVGVSAGASAGRRRRSPAAPPERLQDRLPRLSRRARDTHRERSWHGVAVRLVRAATDRGVL